MQNHAFLDLRKSNDNIFAINASPNVLRARNEAITQCKTSTACHVVLHSCRKLKQEHDGRSICPLIPQNRSGNCSCIQNLNSKFFLEKALNAFHDKWNCTENDIGVVCNCWKRQRAYNPAASKRSHNFHLEAVVLKCHLNRAAEIFKTRLFFSRQI